MCAVALAAVGVGWQPAGHRGQPRAEDRAYCDVDALARYHPAWGQLVQVRNLLARSERVRESKVSEAPDGGRVSLRPTDASLLVDRGALQARLERRADAEIAKMCNENAMSLESRLKEKRQELEARAQAIEAESARQSEQGIAAGLRTLDEEHQSERVDAAIKLAALKAQLSSQAMNSGEVKSAILARQKELDGIRAKLLIDQEDLTRLASFSLSEEQSRHRSEIERELVRDRTRETARIENQCRTDRDRLHRELSADTLGVLGARQGSAQAAGYGGASAGRRGEDIRSAAGSEFVSAAAKSRGDLVGLRSALQARIRAETAVVVRRIARENGLKVTFSPEGGARDKTNWFRERLPYVGAGAAG